MPYRILLLLALLALWVLLYVFLPGARNKDLRVYHFLAILGLVIIYLALSDPVRLTDFFHQLRQGLG